MKQIISKEDGFTGLEAAIVLIAFVVVAAVFSYVVLGAGFLPHRNHRKLSIPVLKWHHPVWKSLETYMALIQMMMMQ